MHTHIKNPVVITKEDFQMLQPYIRSNSEPDGEMTLSNELKRAIIVSKEGFPSNTIRIHSKVSVKDLDTNRVMEFTLVMPTEADMRQNKVSMLAPIAAALIGFRKGEEVLWKVPAGVKRFLILDVINVM